MEKDVLYKALTRPPLIKGVPLPLVIFIVWLTLMLSMYVSYFFIGLGIVAFFICAMLSKNDEMFFFMLIQKMATNSSSSPTLVRAVYGRKLDAVGSTSYRSLFVNDKTIKMNLRHFVDIERWIPYSSHVDNDIIINKNGDLVATWLVNGISFETKGDNELDKKKNELDTFIRAFANESCCIHTNAIRHDVNIDLGGDFSGFWFAEQNNRAYLDYMDSLDNKENVILVSFVLKATDIEEKASGFLDSLFSRKSEAIKAKQDKIERDVIRMRDLCARFNSGLVDFGAKRLSLYEKQGLLFSEQLNFYSYVLTGIYREIALQPVPLSNLMSAEQFIFGTRSIVIKSDLRQEVYIKSIEIKTYSNETCQGIFDFLLTLPVDLTVTQSLSLLSAEKGKELIKSRKRQFATSKDDGVNQLIDLDHFIEKLAGNDTAIGEYYFNVIVRGDSLEQVSDHSKLIIQSLSNRGFISQESTIALKPAFFAQLPGNFRYRTRVIHIKSENFAGMTGLHNFSFGKRKGNCWGDAITVFQTRSGAPYYFNLHEENLYQDDLGKELPGNFMIIGGTGSGKTVLASWILQQCLKFSAPASFKRNIEPAAKNFKFIYFDKDRAVQMHILALGGKYITLRKGIASNQNPFMLESNEHNKKFLISFIKFLCTLDGLRVSTFQERDIEVAVEQVMSRPKEKRAYGISLLRQYLPQSRTAEDKESSIYERLFKWSVKGNLGWLFDNERDDFDLDSYNVFGIDGTEFLEDEEVLQPMMLYLLHKVRLLLNGQRVGVFFDEIQKYAEKPAVDDVIDDLYRVIRKLQGVIGGATQDLTSIMHTKTYKVLVTQTETKIVMPEKDSRPEYFMDMLHFTPKEFEAIESLRRGEREFLVKKTSVDSGKAESVVCRLNLACLGQNLRILSIGSAERAVADKLISETPDPKIWIERLGQLLDENKLTEI